MLARTWSTSLSMTAAAPGFTACRRITFAAKGSSGGELLRDLVDVADDDFVGINPILEFTNASLSWDIGSSS
jgi:hypothetical protein